jgi:hypothetical protein
MSERYALPRWDYWKAVAAEDLALIEAIEGGLKLLLDSVVSRSVTITYWGDNPDRPLMSRVVGSHLLPSATQLIPSAYDWASQATHITIDVSP